MWGCDSFLCGVIILGCGANARFSLSKVSCKILQEWSARLNLLENMDKLVVASRSKKQRQFVEENVDDPRAVKDSGKAWGVDTEQESTDKPQRLVSWMLYALLLGLRACRRPWPRHAGCIDQWFCPR